MSSLTPVEQHSLWVFLATMASAILLILTTGVNLDLRTVGTALATAAIAGLTSYGSAMGWAVTPTTGTGAASATGTVPPPASK